MIATKWEWCLRKYPYAEAEGKLNAGIGYYLIKKESDGTILAFRRPLSNEPMKDGCYKVQNLDILNSLDEKLNKTLGVKENQLY